MSSTHFLRGFFGLLTALALTSASQAQMADSKIAFCSGRDGNREVYVMNPDGANLINLTRHPADDRPSSWSPDGTKIAFSSTRDGNDEVYVMNADGTNPTRLTYDPASDALASWSPDGRRLSFISRRDGNYEIYVMNADGTNPINLTRHPASDLYPSWSPDGTKIAFSSERDGNSEIYVINADGTNPIRLTNHPALDQRPSWSPDGTRIAFRSFRSGDGEVYVMNADGSNPVNLQLTGANNGRPSWSPDGTRIAVSSNRENRYNYEIYVISLDGTAPPIKLTSGSNACWSPFLMLEVLCDVKPGPEPNEINLRGQGVIPVAILTTPQFDVRMVDPMSVVFGPGRAREAHGQGHLEDVDGDGDFDMMFHFRAQESGIQPGDTRVTLSGRTVQGRMFKGSDGIVTR